MGVRALAARLGDIAAEPVPVRRPGVCVVIGDETAEVTRGIFTVSDTGRTKVGLNLNASKMCIALL